MDKNLTFRIVCISDLPIAHRPVIVLDEVFERLDQPPLHVSSLCCLDSCVNQTLSSAHCMKEELCRGQTRVETVFDKTFGGRNLAMSLKMGQCSVLKSIGDSFAVDGLLSDTSDHLGDVDERAFGAT